MVRRTALTMILLAGCVWCLTLVARADSESNPPSDSFEPAATIGDLMYGQAQHFKTVSQLVRNKNAKDRADRIAPGCPHPGATARSPRTTDPLRGVEALRKGM